MQELVGGYSGFAVAFFLSSGSSATGFWDPGQFLSTGEWQHMAGIRKDGLSWKARAVIRFFTSSLSFPHHLGLVCSWAFVLIAGVPGNRGLGSVVEHHLGLFSPSLW